jgi:hypothetical protein
MSNHVYRVNLVVSEEMLIFFIKKSKMNALDGGDTGAPWS